MKSNAVPPDLAEVVAAWGRLPPAIRVGVLAMCEPREGKAWQGDERSGTAPED